MFQYPPPPAYMAFDYRTPPLSPSPVGNHAHPYSPRYSVHTATPSPRASPKVHARRASQGTTYAHHASPRVAAAFYTPAGYTSASSPRYYTSPQRKTDHVSSSGHHHYGRGRSDSRYVHVAPPLDAKHGGRSASRGGKQYRSSRSRKGFNVADGDCGCDFDAHYDAPPPYEAYENCRPADYHPFYDQVPVYTEAEPTVRRSRARRASHSARPEPPPPRPRPATAAKSPPKATEDDARRAGIPAGYSFKNWDPTEEPILLLGSVFDANSLGKWIYDWTVFRFGAATPMSEMAGEMWLLLIQLAGKIKRAEECMSKIRKIENRELVEDFLESGDRLWVRFAKLLKVCETYMWQAARRDSVDRKPVKMGKNSGCEFVDSIFGRDRELEKTEKLMTGMRLWSMRFDANCEEILRRPTA